MKKLQDGYDNIGSSEKKKLENVIPYYKKIFGEIIPNRTYFVYYYIDNLDNINQIKESIFNFILTGLLTILGKPKKIINGVKLLFCGQYRFLVKK